MNLRYNGTGIRIIPRLSLRYFRHTGEEGMEMNDNRSAYNACVYDEHIVNVLPYYGEYHKQVIDLVKTMGLTAPDWLDTGCGTGTLCATALETLPNARFTLCDPSEKMLNEARAKLKGKDVHFLNVPSGQLPFDAEFDVVTAIQSHHYCRPDERKQAVLGCYRALREGGVFVAFENIRMSTDISDAIALKRWANFLAEHGNSGEDVQMHMDRRGVEIFPITIGQHIALLRECGFSSVNILWVSYLQAGFWAIR